MNKKFLMPAIVLGAICAVAAILLAFINKVTAPAIAIYEESVVMNALSEVSCSYDIGSKVEVADNPNVTCYYQLKDNGKYVGNILELKSNGYGGEMKLVCSYDKNGLIMACKLISDSETPGVGKKAELPGYMDKFIGTGSSAKPVPTSKSMLSSADSATVSGASMTFNGVSKALKIGSDFAKTIKEVK